MRLIDWQCPALGDPAEDIACFLSPAMQVIYGAGPLDAARERQLRVRESFQRYLGEGLYVAGFEADRGGGESRYLFYRDEHEEEG